MSTNRDAKTYIKDIKCLDLHEQLTPNKLDDALINLDLDILKMYDMDKLTAIPNNLYRLNNLTVLSVIEGYLEGSIPSQLGLLTNLKKLLSLHNNHLTGTVPESILRLKHLEEFDVSKNRLEGNVPDLSSLLMIHVIDLSYNKFTGSLPKNLPRYYNLIKYSVECNELTGTIPDNTFNSRYIQAISFSNNNITGTLPSGLTGARQLVMLEIHNNPKLEGEIRCEVVVEKFLIDGEYKSMKTTVTKDLPIWYS